MKKRAIEIPEAVQLNAGDSLLSRQLLPLIVLIPALLFVYTLPHVIALRNVVILALLIFVFWSLAKARASLGLGGLKYPLVLLLILQVWLVVVSVFLAPDVLGSLREWVSQWLKSAIVFVIGIGAGLILAREMPVRLREIVTAVLVLLPFAALALIHCVLAVKYYSPSVYMTEYFGPSGHRANITHVAALGLPVVLVDISERLFRGRRLLPGPWYVPAICMALFLGATLTSGTRNGILVTGFVVAVWTLWILQRLMFSGRSRIALLVAAASGCALAGAMAFNLMTDPRWDSFVETAEVAWQTDEHAAWYRFQDVPLPRLQNGQVVEESAYLRVAFLKEGTKLLFAHPWGTEISRHSFENLLAAKYGDVSVTHSHIGVIDFGLSAGFPGIVVWVLFLGSLSYLGWREYTSRGNAMGLVLLIVVFSFFMRMFVDSTLREHILQQFMLVAGLLLAVTMPAQETSKHG